MFHRSSYGWSPFLVAGSVIAAMGCAGSSEPPPVRPATEVVPVAAPPVPPLDPNLASFDYVWTTIRDKHWDPSLHGVDWDAVRAELRPRVVAARTTAETRAVIEEMLGRLGQSHFAVFPGVAYEALSPTEQEPVAAADPAEDSGRDDGATSDGTETGPPPPGADPAGEADHGAGGEGTIGVTMAVLDGAAIITRVLPDSSAAGAGIAAGWQIAKIGKTDVAEVIAKVAQTFAGSTILDGMLARALEGRLDGRVGTAVQLELHDATGKPVTRRVVRGEPSGKLVVFGNLPPLYLRYESRRLGRDVGYIAFNVFFDPALVMESFGRDVAAFADTRGLVIDLRGNPGGIGGMAMGMGGWFVSAANQALGTMTTRGTSLRFVLNPRPPIYAGKLAILIDGGSMSTAEIFAAGLQDLGRARLFGTRTGGAALPSTIERLPNGDGFQYAFANYISANGAELEGKGVAPDVEVRLSREALLTGRDPVVDAAVAWIHSKP